jgi:hypothetical protein
MQPSPPAREYAYQTQGCINRIHSSEQPRPASHGSTNQRLCKHKDAQSVADKGMRACEAKRRHDHSRVPTRENLLCHSPSPTHAAPEANVTPLQGTSNFSIQRPSLAAHMGLQAPPSSAASSTSHPPFANMQFEHGIAPNVDQIIKALGVLFTPSPEQSQPEASQHACPGATRVYPSKVMNSVKHYTALATPGTSIDGEHWPSPRTASTPGIFQSSLEGHRVANGLDHDALQNVLCALTKQIDTMQASQRPSTEGRSCGSPSSQAQRISASSTCAETNAALLHGASDGTSGSNVQRQVSFQDWQRIRKASGTKHNFHRSPVKDALDSKELAHKEGLNVVTDLKLTHTLSPIPQANQPDVAPQPRKHRSASNDTRVHRHGGSLANSRQSSPSIRAKLPPDGSCISPRLLNPLAPSNSASAHADRGSLTGPAVPSRRVGCARRATPGSPSAAAWVPPGHHNGTFSAVGAVRVLSRSLSRINSSPSPSVHASPGTHNVHPNQRCVFLGTGSKPGSPRQSPANDTISGFRQPPRDPSSGLPLPRQPLSQPTPARTRVIHGANGQPWPVSGTSRPTSAKLQRSHTPPLPSPIRPHSACSARSCKAAAPSSPQDDAHYRLKLDAMHANRCTEVQLAWDGRKSRCGGPAIGCSQSRSRSSRGREHHKLNAIPNKQSGLKAYRPPAGKHEVHRIGTDLMDTLNSQVDICTAWETSAMPKHEPQLSCRAWKNYASQVNPVATLKSGNMEVGELDEGPAGEARERESPLPCQVQEESVRMDELANLQAAMDSFSKVRACYNVAINAHAWRQDCCQKTSLYFETFLPTTDYHTRGLELSMSIMRKW